MQMGLPSNGAPTQPHAPTLQQQQQQHQQQQQQQMQQMYNPYFNQQQQGGPQMQQLFNGVGSGVSAGVGGPPGSQPNTLAMAQQQQLNAANHLNFVPPATRPAQVTNMLSQAQRGFYSPAMAAQVRFNILISPY